MKKEFIFLLIAILSLTTKSSAQSIYQRIFTPYVSGIQQERLANDDLIIAGNNFGKRFSGIPVARFNSCGNLLWSLRISDTLTAIELVSMKLDQQENIILGGNYFQSPNARNAFVASVSKTGSLNYFKTFDTGTADIFYSLDISPSNEIYAYFKVNIGQAGPNSNNTVAKLSADGQVKWIKRYGFTYVWGQMCASADGGVLISDNNEICKINANGEVDWNKTYSKWMYQRNHFAVPGGYVFFRYNNSQLNYASAMMLDLNGNLKWNSQVLNSFNPIRGILRKNGNLLFLGDFENQAITNNPSLIEIDTSDGSIIKTIEHAENSPLIRPMDLNELSDGNIVYSGTEELSFGGGMFITRTNANIERVSCYDSLINLNFPNDTTRILSAPKWQAQNTTINFINASIEIEPFQFGEALLKCFYNPLTVDLGNDTTICQGQNLTLVPNKAFAGYLWSTGENSAQITISKSGTYWLKAWTACDTISDTIIVKEKPAATIKYSYKPESFRVLDSIELKVEKPDSTQSISWDFGDGEISSERNTFHYYSSKGKKIVRLTIIDSLACSYTREFYVNVEALPYQIPNVFTPNGDGVNDVFYLLGNGVKELKLLVYNRWGELVYSSQNTAWTGKNNAGKNCVAGTYYYEIYFIQLGNTPQKIKGSVQLIR